MPFTYDISTDRGKVRLLIPDTDEDNAIFQDADIDGFLELEDADVRLAAATALEVIASNEAMVQKVQRTLDLTTDGAKTSDALLKRAEKLRDQAINGSDGGGDFEIAEHVGDQFTWRQHLHNEMLREGG